VINRKKNKTEKRAHFKAIAGGVKRPNINFKLALNRVVIQGLKTKTQLTLSVINNTRDNAKTDGKS